MLNTRLTVTRELTLKLAKLEQLLDQVVVAQAELQIAAVQGRRAAHLPLDAGEAGLQRLAEAGASLLGARAAIHAAHYDFRDVRDTMGLPVHAYGDGGDTPSSFTEGAKGALTLVDRAA